jgi:hypothetical protein
MGKPGLDENLHEADNSEKRRLVLEIDFPEDVAERAVTTDVAKTLLHLLDEDFKMTEEERLLVMIMEPNENQSLHYTNYGNYGLPHGAPGARPWPGGVCLAPGAPPPPGVAMMPPNALGRFIANIEGVREISNGNFNVFLVADYGILHSIPALLISEEQFRRIGPILAATFPTTLACEPALVQFYTLESIRGPPHYYPNVNQSA